MVKLAQQVPHVTLSVAPPLSFRELKKVGHIRTKPPFILPVAEEFFLGEWYITYVWRILCITV